MIPVIQKEVIEKRKWVGKAEFLQMLALSQSSPGPMAVNTAVMVGYRLYKTTGAVISFLGTVLPSFIILLLIAMFFPLIYHDPAVVSIFKGIRPAVAALILHPVYNFSKEVTYWEYPVFFAVAAAVYFGFSPVYFIVIAILIGTGYTIYRNKK